MGSLLIRWERVRRIYSDAVQVSESASEELTDKLRTANPCYQGEAVLCTPPQNLRTSYKGAPAHRQNKRSTCPLLDKCFFGDPSETRTPDPLIKSQVLYRLS